MKLENVVQKEATRSQGEKCCVSHLSLLLPKQKGNVGSEREVALEGG